MTPKEKAKQLIEDFEIYSFDEGDGGLVYDPEDTKMLASICAETHIYRNNETSPFVSMDAWFDNNEYWKEVKKHIEEL